ncbi:zinc-binding domain-containing protein [Pestalotiopsis sp. NC0098]|nr:zinc-binding domain-containing protein [Pestalotiopsis sp. NC0098]
MARSKSNAKDWSMYSKLHQQVLQQLRTSGLTPKFHYKDDTVGCTKKYDTHIMGDFRCFNNKCSSKGWSSRKIAITIRLYHDGEYNAIVYHQLCKNCEKPSKPSLDGSYADRISYRLKKWSGLEVTGYFKPQMQTKWPHEKDLCLGCKNGHCREGEIA